MNGEGTDGFEELMAKGNEPGRLDNVRWEMTLVGSECCILADFHHLAL